MKFAILFAVVIAYINAEASPPDNCRGCPQYIKPCPKGQEWKRGVCECCPSCHDVLGLGENCALTDSFCPPITCARGLECIRDICVKAIAV